MNTNKIREALMNGSLEARIDAIAELDKAQQPAEPVAYYVERVVPGLRDNGVKMGPFFMKEEAEELADEFHFVRSLYAHPPQAQQPGKVLTDEEIERIARYEFRRVSDQDGLHDDNADKRDAFADGLRYARDNYGIGTPAAGLTVEEALKAITPFTSNEIMEHYRARLTAALEAKTRTA